MGVVVRDIKPVCPGTRKDDEIPTWMRFVSGGAAGAAKPGHEAAAARVQKLLF